MPDIIEVFCVKDFLYDDKQYTKNKSYGLIEYDNTSKHKSFYIVEIPKGEGPLPAYSLTYGYRKNFISLKELRKQKLEKINGSKLIILYKRFFEK